MIEVSNLIEGAIAELAQLKEEAEGLSTGSSGSNFVDSFDLSDDDKGKRVAGIVGDEEEDIEVEEGEEVNQREDQIPDIVPLT